MTTTPEGRVSAALRQCVISAGGEIRKVMWQGRGGAPDWLVMLSGGAVFVETKAPGETPRASQIIEFRRIKHASGIPVLVLDSAARANDIVRILTARAVGDYAAYTQGCAEFSFERYTGVNL